jgi:hypothetical protein
MRTINREHKTRKLDIMEIALRRGGSTELTLRRKPERERH